MKVGIILAALAVAMGNAYADGKDNNVAAVAAQETGKSYEEAAIVKLNEALDDQKSPAEVIEQKLLAAENLFKTAAEFYQKEANKSKFIEMWEKATDVKSYRGLVKTPKPYDNPELSIAWEAYGQNFYTSASSMSNPTLAKELFQRSAEYFEYAAHVNFKQAQDFNKDPKKSELYHRNAAGYFKKASISFKMAGDKINADKMQDKANEMEALLTQKTEEHLATFVTSTAPGGKLQQTK